jgi:hypothetical protein
MRKSDVYNSLIKPKVVKDLTEKFTFKGHLGDQDFFSLLSMEHKELLGRAFCQGVFCPVPIIFPNLI